MNKILALSFLFIFANTLIAQDDDAWVRPTATDYPVVAKTGKQISDFVPHGFQIVTTVTGDLNGDKRADVAVHLIGTSEKFLNKNDSLGADVYNTNPRILVLLLKDRSSNSYRLAEQNNTFIIPPLSPVNSETFAGMSIKKGVLTIELELWQSAGSWSQSQCSYMWQLINGKFYLIGVDRNYSLRNSGETDDRNYNFLTGRVRKAKGNFSDDGPGKVTWKTLKKQKLKTFETFPTPFEWEIEKDIFI